MKKYLVSLLLATPFLSIAQDWTQISINTIENLNTVHFVNDDLGFIIGDNGFMARSIDGGSTWSNISTGATHDLHAIAFINDTTGHVNGLVTTDGGINWVSQSSTQQFGVMYAQGPYNMLAGLHSNSGGFAGEIYQSIDSGATWTVIAMPFASNPNGASTGAFDDVSFVSDTLGYMSAWYSGHLVKTMDGGLTWSEVLVDTVDGNSWFSDDFRSVSFPSLNTGVMTHDDGIIKTTDGGTTWSEIGANIGSSLYLRSIVANSEDNYIVVGNNSGGPGLSNKIHETTDGGATWVSTNNIIHDLHDLACNSRACYAVGSNGSVFKSVSSILGDGGSSIMSKRIAIYPNPVVDNITVDTYGDNIRNIHVFGVNGKIQDIRIIGPNKIDVADLSRGFYFLSFEIDDETHKIRFIKK